MHERTHYMLFDGADRYAEAPSDFRLLQSLKPVQHKGGPCSLRQILQRHEHPLHLFPAYKDAIGGKVLKGVKGVVILDMIIGPTRPPAPGAVDEHVRSGLEEVALDMIDVAMVVALSEPHEDFMCQIFAFSLEARRTSFEKPNEGAAIASSQAVKKRA
jgi:hypothetical protein